MRNALEYTMGIWFVHCQATAEDPNFDGPTWSGAIYIWVVLTIYDTSPNTSDPSGVMLIRHIINDSLGGLYLHITSMNLGISISFGGGGVSDLHLQTEYKCVA